MTSVVNAGINKVGEGTRQVAQRMGEAATNFLAALSPDQKDKARLALSDEQRRTIWHYTPIPRDGLPLTEMDRPQQQLAMKLVATGVSEGAFGITSVVMGLENTLDMREKWQRPLPGRDSRLYYVRIFGEPHVVRSAAYVVNEHPRPPLSLSRLLAELPPASALHEPAIPYPQANDLDKVLDVVAKIEADIRTKQEIADAFEFDERQGDYYANAASYLGLVERDAQGFEVTAIGANYLQTRSRTLRNEIVARQLLMRPTFRQIFERLQQLNFELVALSNQEMATTIAAHTELSGSTPARRAQTMRSWLATLLRNAEFHQ